MIKFFILHLVIDTLRAYRVERVPQLMRNRSINKIQQLVLILNLLTLYSIGDIDELQHNCIFIFFIQFSHFDAVEL